MKERGHIGTRDPEIGAEAISSATLIPSHGNTRGRKPKNRLAMRSGCIDILKARCRRLIERGLAGETIKELRHISARDVCIRTETKRAVTVIPTL